MAETKPLYTWSVDEAQKNKEKNKADGAEVPRTSFDDSLTFGPPPQGPQPQRTFATMVADIPEREQAISAAYQTTAQQLDGTVPGASLARNQFLKGQQEALRDIKETSAVGGRADTGQIRGDVAQFYTQRAMPARADFEARITADAEARKGQAVQNLIGLETLGQTEQLTLEQLKSGEKIAFAGIAVDRDRLVQEAQQFDDEMDFNRWATQAGLDDKIAARLWTAGQNDLNRELDKMIAMKGYDIDLAQLAETARQFDSRLDFDEWATNMGFDENEKSRLHDLKMQEINQRFQTGERLGAQDWQYIMEDIRINANEQEMILANTLQLNTMEQQNIYDKAMVVLREDYAAKARLEGFNHDEAMVVYQAGVKERLLAMGYTQDQALQAAEIEADRVNLNRQLAHTEMLSLAQMAQDDKHVFAQLGIRKEELELTRTQVTDELLTMGVQRSLLENEVIMDGIEQAALIFEMAEGNQDMTDMAAQHFFNTMGPALGLSKSQITAGIEAMTQGTEADPTIAAGVLGQYKSDIAHTTLTEDQARDKAKGSLVDLSGNEAAKIVQNDDLIKQYRDAGIIEVKTPVLDVGHMLRQSDWDAQGFNEGDIVVVEIDGEPQLIQIAGYNSEKSEKKPLGIGTKSWRNGQLIGINITRGDKEPTVVWETGFKEI